MHVSSAALTDARLIAGYVIFFGSYLVFALGKFPGMKIDRPGAAIIGAVLMFAFRIVQPDDVARFIDYATLVLLFSMMLIVANLRLVGFFDAVAEVAIGRLGAWHLLPAVIFTSGVLSAFFVNDIICLVMVPFVLHLTRRMGLPPLAYLLAVATGSNIGSVASITGNPQNMLIGSVSGIRYPVFLAHLGPVALVGLFLDWAILHWLFPYAEHAPAVTREPHPPRRRSLKTAVVVLGVLLGLLAGLPPVLVSAVGAAILLMTRTLDPHLVYEEVDWGMLVFFVGLFLIVGGAENIGLTRHLLDIAQRWNLHNAVVFTTATAALSNIVSNVPAVMLLKSTVPGLPNPHQSWLLLAMASTLAGNLTITGSIANIIVVERARPEVVIGFRDYLRVGVPVTLATLAFGTVWLWWVG